MHKNCWKSSKEFSKSVQIYQSVGTENRRAKNKSGHSTSTQQWADMKCPK